MESSQNTTNETLMMVARLTAQEGHVDTAINLYTKILENGQDSAEAYFERGRLYYQQGDSQRAMADMQRFLALRPGEMEKISGNYQAEGAEEGRKRSFSALNPFGL